MTANDEILLTCAVLMAALFGTLFWLIREEK